MSSQVSQERKDKLKEKFDFGQIEMRRMQLMENERATFDALRRANDDHNWATTLRKEFEMEHPLSGTQAQG